MHQQLKWAQTHNKFKTKNWYYGDDEQTQIKSGLKIIEIKIKDNKEIDIICCLGTNIVRRTTTRSTILWSVILCESNNRVSDNVK